MVSLHIQKEIQAKPQTCCVFLLDWQKSIRVFLAKCLFRFAFLADLCETVAKVNNFVKALERLLDLKQIGAKLDTNEKKIVCEGDFFQF